ncbi:i-spanin [Stenotrophomonas phage Summit]|nr:i-spanin [Stenotrophomonas phage Summit]
MPFVWTPLATRLVIIGVVLVAAFIGIRLWIANHDSARDTKLTEQSNVRTEKAADKIEDKAEDLSGDQKAAEDAVQTIHTQTVTRYVEIRKDPAVAAAADTPVPVQLRELAKSAREQRERLDRDREGRQ